MNELTCCVEGCEERPVKRTYCNVHYLRVLRHGDPGSPGRMRRKPGEIAECIVDDCSRRAKSRGYCNTHAERIRRNGTLEVLGVQSGASSPNWQGDEITYRTAHGRVTSLRGRARDHDCDWCGKQAVEWAYDHCDANELTSNNGAYSSDPSHYLPMCKSCHVKLDKRHARDVRLSVAAAL